MTMFEKMLIIAPIRLERLHNPAVYRCTWSVSHSEGKHAIGEGPSPYHAVTEAFKDAVKNGWATY